MTENKTKTALPTLRFAEFDGEWEVEVLTGKDVAVFVKEKIPVHELRSGFYVSTENLLPDYAGVVAATKLPASGSFTRFNKGDILVSNIRPYLKKVWLSDVSGAASNDVIIIRAGEKVISEFLSFQLKNDYFIDYVMKGAEGVKMPRGDKDEIRKYPLLFPKKEEQQKIAATLSSLDELIAAESEKLQALHVHKRGLMQGLFPAEGETVPRLRFPEFEGEWEVEVLTGKDVAVFVKEKIPVHELRSGFYVSTENLLPDYAGVVAATKLPASGSFTRFNKGDILVSNIRPYLKKVWLSDVSGAASNDVIIIRAGEKVISEFLSFQLKNDYFIDYVMKGAEGVKMPRGDKDEIRKYPLLFPKKEEQQKIAATLSSLDELITAQRETIEALKLHKKGLMQGLFPS